jgi:GNAT superfamily N-acetyltransferase
VEQTSTDADIEIRSALSGELETVISILEEASCWIADKGIPQWWPGLFSKERRSEVERALGRGETYLVRRGGEPIATLALKWSDPRWWPQAGEDAGYVHRVAVRRPHAGQGVGRMLLDWAARETAAKERKYLRLGCMAENAELCHYYQKCGFNYRGELCVGGFKSALWKKEVEGANVPKTSDHP